MRSPWNQMRCAARRLPRRDAARRTLLVQRVRDPYPCPDADDAAECAEQERGRREAARPPELGDVAADDPAEAGAHADHGAHVAEIGGCALRLEALSGAAA